VLRTILHRASLLLMVIAVGWSGLASPTCRRSSDACHACCAGQQKEPPASSIVAGLPDCCRVIAAAPARRVQATPPSSPADAPFVAIVGAVVSTPTPPPSVVAFVDRVCPPDTPAYLAKRSLLL
jgi:hypothetical protein